MNDSPRPTSRTPDRGTITRRHLGQGAALLSGAVLAGLAPWQATRWPGTQGARAQGAPTGTLTVSLPAGIVGLDALGAQGAEEPTRIIAQHVFDSLVVRNGETGEYEPSLATAWETPDPTTWVFTLREDAVFHDGAPVTAADVVASLTYLIEAAGPLAPLWAWVDEMTAPDATTFQLTTTEPMGTMLPSLALFSVMPAAGLAEAGFFNQPIGSGPFQITSYQPDQELVLEAFADYWGTPPGVATLRFVTIPELAARVTALTTGEIDFTYQLPPDQVSTLEGDSNLTVTLAPSFRHYFIWMNAQTDNFADARVRQAMIHALDIEAIRASLFGDLAELMDSPLPAAVFGYAPQTPYAYDPARAQELLTEAGFPDGIQTDMIWAPGSSPLDREIAQTLFAYWSTVGVTVNDRGSERAQWLDALLALDWEMDFQTLNVTTGDADYSLRRLYESSANRTGYANPELDDLLNAAASSLDQDERLELYAQAGAIVWDDAVGIFPFVLVQSFAARNRVSGLLAVPGLPDFTTVTVSD